MVTLELTFNTFTLYIHGNFRINFQHFHFIQLNRKQNEIWKTIWLAIIWEICITKKNKFLVNFVLNFFLEIFTNFVMKNNLQEIATNFLAKYFVQNIFYKKIWKKYLRNL